MGGGREAGGRGEVEKGGVGEGDLAIQSEDGVGGEAFGGTGEE